MSIDDLIPIATLVIPIAGLVIGALQLFYGARTFYLAKRKQENHLSEKPKKLILLSVTIMLLASVLICQLVQNTKPVLVFAGGGSVRKFLQEEYKVDVRKQGNSINIAMASGSAWRVLAEEYHNKNNYKKKDNSKKFITICLSAGRIPQEFYNEFISSRLPDNTTARKWDDAIIAEVYLGEDNLVAYLSNSLKKRWNLEEAKTIRLDTLAEKLQRIIEGKDNFAVFTTNKMSGTLEQYKKSFKDSKNVQDLKKLLVSRMLDDSIAKLHIDTIQDPIMKSFVITRIHNSIEKRSFVNLEKMLDDQQAFTYYEKTKTENIYSCYSTISRPFILLGSKYYFVNGLTESNSGLDIVEIFNDNKQKINKPMYLYFLAYQTGSDPVYEVDGSIIKFLKKIEKGKLFKIDGSKRDEWEKMMDDKIIEHPNPTTNMGRIKNMNYEKE